jgi:hypothetical protein
MSLSADGDPRRATGYPLKQLASAFDRVMDPRDWQAPIRSVIPEADRDVVEKAVRWFTETVPVFEPAGAAADRLLVMAPGYRLGKVGAARGGA